MLLTNTIESVQTPRPSGTQCDLLAQLTQHPRLSRLLGYLETHPSLPLTTGTAAKIVCFQENYFCTLFKRETGRTFSSWQRAWRVSGIATVLLTENVSIARAAERYGYLNMRTFERAFKAHFSISAREFRRRHGWQPRQWCRSG